MNASSSIAKPATPLPLKIEMDLDIQHAEALHHLLLAQPASPVVALDLSAVATCDLTGLQLLLSAQRTAVAGGGIFLITAFSPAIATACNGLGLDISQLSTSAL